jgi:hypothetical protein
MTALDRVSHCAVGAAVQEIRGRAAADEGHSLLAELHRSVAARAPNELVGLPHSSTCRRSASRRTSTTT